MAIDDNGVVTFTPEEQAKVDSIVGERLAREKANFADYDDLKELVPVLQDFGYKGTIPEIKAVLRAQAEEVKTQREQQQKQAELEALKDEANKNGTSTELLADIKTLKAEIAELKKDKQDKKQHEEQEIKSAEAWKVQIAEFDEKYPDIDLEKLAKNPDFMEFYKDSNISLSVAQVYERFVKFVGKINEEAITKVKSKELRSTPSGKGASNSDGQSYGLNAGQKATVDEWNQRNPKNPMTYKQFAEM